MYQQILNKFRGCDFRYCVPVGHLHGSDELSRVTKQENPGFRNAPATLHLFQATVPLEEISYAKHPSTVTVAGPVDL